MSEPVHAPLKRGRPKGAMSQNRRSPVTNRRRGIGPHSAGERLARLDRRTVEGKFVESLRAEFLEFVGGAPSVVQRVLIDRACVLSLRLAQIDRRVYEDREFTEIDTNSTIAWSNALTRTLLALGFPREAASHRTTVPLGPALAEMGYVPPPRRSRAAKAASTT